MPARSTWGRMELCLLGAAAVTAACTTDGRPGPAVAAASMPAVDWTQPTVTIGPFDYTPGTSFTWVGDSALALIDLEDAVVRRVTLGGVELPPIGRKGGGPGEFRAPMLLHARADGALLVADAQLRRVSYSDASGRIVDDVSMPSIPTHILRWEGTRVELVWGGFMRSDTARLGVVDLGTGAVEAVWTLPTLHPSLAVGSGEGDGVEMVAAVAGAGEVLLASPWRYEVLAFDAAGAVRRRYVRADVAPALPSEQETAATEKRLAEQMRKHGMPMSEEVRQLMARQAATPKPFFKVNALSLDPAGRLWVAAERHNDAGTEFDVFDDAGAFLGTLVVPRKVRSLAFHKDAVAVLSESTAPATDGQSVVEIFRY